MRQYAICPICKAQIFPGNSDVTPREELENHLHNEEARTWVQAPKMARSSIVILGGKRLWGKEKSNRVSNFCG